MQKEKFYREIADILEVDDLTDTDILANYATWDSLSILSAVAMIGSRYRVNLTARDLRSVATAGELYDLVAAHCYS